jgi:hypothetical protein
MGNRSMITLHDAIYALNPSIITIRDNVAYDENQNVIEYDMASAQNKLTELQNAEQSAKQSAIAKLTAIGLTADEIAALGVK